MLRRLTGHSVLVWMLCCGLSHLGTCSNFPPFFNAASRKTVGSMPVDVTCGESGPVTYCESSSDSQSTRVCTDETCTAACPYEDSFPRYETFARLISPTFNWGNCVLREPNVSAPTTSTGECLRFSGTGTDCDVPLQTDWLVNIIFLRPIWQTSFTVWIYNDQGNSEGTLLDAFFDDTSPESVLRISLRNDHLKITSGSVELTSPSWHVPYQRWTLLGIQLYDTSVAVFLDGNRVVPTYHNITLRSNRNARTWLLGKSHADYDPFVGYLQDFRVYDKVLVNRGMAKEYNNGTVETTRIYSECLCPDEHPLLKESDPTFCVQNPGEYRKTTEVYRLNRHVHALQFVNDDKENSAWLTATPLDRVSLEIDLGAMYEVRHVDVILYSPIPSLLTIEKQGSDGKWSPWQHFSVDCRTWTNMTTDGNLIREDDVNCKYIVRFEEQYIYSSARLQFDALEGRPGAVDDLMPPQLRDFLLARAIRVTMKGHPFVSNDQHKYHAISEIKVNATCDCNGHGVDCYLDQSPYVCQCFGPSYTRGRQCDSCVPNAYRTPGLDVYHPDYCQPCDCYQAGTVGAVNRCQEVGGQCVCKSLATGRACDQCREGYFNLTADNPAGCQTCDCHTNGTVNGSQTCDLITGQCLCKANVGGLKCDVCKSGYTQPLADHEDGCVGCTCDEAGTAPGNDSCILDTGECICKQFVIGRECEQCVDGTYNLQQENADGCQLCRCDLAFGSINTTCHPITGQCSCQTNVEGQHCDRCTPGYYTTVPSDATVDGCSQVCDCHPTGTLPGEADVCQQVGGQCSCKPTATGRRCHQCAPGFYGFGTVSAAVCRPCDCDVTGTVNGSTDCDQTTGYCQCKIGVTGPRCDSCMDGFYRLSNNNQDTCSSCSCAQRGTVPGSVCDPATGKCVCGTNGDLQLGGRTCAPYITSVYPYYGPLSGGTKISMETGFLGNISTVDIRLSDVSCNINRTLSNDTYLRCTSSALPARTNHSQILYQPQPITITWSDGDFIDTPQTFMYMNDPVIETIQPLRTIVSGGINLTVTGEYLNSVMSPKMTVTMVIRPAGKQVVKETFTTVCTVRDTSTMTCPTPGLTIPALILERNRRSIEEHYVNAPARVRRQTTDADDLNDDMLNFYLGFILDGVEIYRNMSLVNPDYGILRVFRNPEFEMFDGENNIKVLRKYWPIQENHILIKGSRMNHGLSTSDYTIVLGQDYCRDLELYESFISCIPPATQPPLSADWPAISDHPRVMVRVAKLQFLVGFLRYDTTIWSYRPFRYGIIGSCCALALIVLLIVLCCCISKRNPHKVPESVSSKSTKSGKSAHSKGRPMSFISAYESKDGTIKPYMITSDADIISLLPGELRVAILDLIVDESMIDLGRVVGEGHFGKVYVGNFRTGEGVTPEPVAIKTLKEGGARTRHETIQFLEEATMMKDFQHSNVLSVKAVVLTDTGVQVILPYMENGDLKSFISKEDNLLTVGELIHFGLQIATGMAYLAEARFVHRDLACRNCMVNKHLIVKVADFGLSRDIYEQDYYRVGTKKRPLPVKWMGIESLDKGVWTTKSDVWSYGVVLWELLTRGCPPYPDVDVFDVKTYLSRGNRMDRPDYAPDEIYALMLKCWQEDVDKRPSFRQIRDRMSYFLNEVNTHTFKRDKQGQQVPSIAFRGRSYLNHIG